MFYSVDTKTNYKQKIVIRPDIYPHSSSPLSLGQFSHTLLLLSKWSTFAVLQDTAIFISAGQCRLSQVSFSSLYCYPWLNGEDCHASCQSELVLISPQPHDASGVF